MKLRFQDKISRQGKNIMCTTVKIRRTTMGQCYSVNLKIKLKPNSEKRAADALKTHMFNKIKVNSPASIGSGMNP